MEYDIDQSKMDVYLVNDMEDLMKCLYLFHVH